VIDFKEIREGIRLNNSIDEYIKTLDETHRQEVEKLKCQKVDLLHNDIMRVYLIDLMRSSRPEKYKGWSDHKIFDHYYYLEEKYGEENES